MVNRFARDAGRERERGIHYCSIIDYIIYIINTGSIRMNEGKLFEMDFKRSIPEGHRYYYERRRDGTAGFRGRKNENVRFQMTNICDCSVFDNDNGIIHYFELKSYKGKSVPFSGLRTNQIRGISEASRGLRSLGYVVFNMRNIGKTYIVEIEEVVRFMALEDRKSFPLDWMEETGYELGQKQLRTRYKYDLSTFFEGMADLVLDNR